MILFPDPIPEIVLTNNNESISIGKDIEIFEDKGGTLSIHDFLNKNFKGNFEKLNKEFINYGFTKSTIWVRFKLKKNLEVKTRSPWVIVNEFPMIDHTHFYQIKQNNILERKVETGIMHQISSRDHIYYKIVFLSNIPPGESRTLYISFRTNKLLSLNLRVLSMTEFMKDSGIKIAFIGIFIGVFLFLCGYHLFLFFANWEYTHLFFSLTILSMLLYALSYTGYAGLNLWPDLLFFKKYSIHLFACLIQIFLLCFINSFFKLRQNKTFIYKLSRLLIFSLLMFTSLSIVTGSNVALTITEIIVVITFFSIPFIVLRLKGDSEKKPFYFITGTLIFVSTVLVFIFDKLSIVSLKMLPEYALRIGPGIFIILTSLSLAERTKSLKEAKNRVETDLKDSRQRFKSLVESSYDIIWETDKNGIFTYISPNVKEIIGFEPSHLTGKKIEDIFIAEGDESSYNPFSDKKTDKKPVIGLINSIKDFYNKKVSFETNALPFYNNDGHFQGYRGINREITDRLRSEKVQEIIFNISDSVNTSINMDEFYEIIHSELNKIVDATNFFVGIYEKDTDSTYPSIFKR